MGFEKEREVVGEVVQFLQENDYQVTRVFDGEEYMEKPDLEEALQNNDIEAITEYTAAAESGSVMFKDPDGQRFAIHMIYGNSPEEAIADISASNDEALDRGVALVNARLEDLTEETGVSPSL